MFHVFSLVNCQQTRFTALVPGDRKNPLNSTTVRLAAPTGRSASKQGTTVRVARLFHERVSTAVPRTRTLATKTSVGVVLSPFFSVKSRPNGRRRKARIELGCQKLRWTRSERLRSRWPDLRAPKRPDRTERFSSRKIDRNRNDARHVTRPGQWGRCIPTHLPVPRVAR